MRQVTVPKNISYAKGVADRLYKLRRCREAYEMKSRGYSLTEISIQFDVSETRVKQLIKSHEHRLDRERQNKLQQFVGGHR